MREGESCTAGSLVHRQDRCKCIAKLRGGQESDSGDEKDGCVEKVCQGKQVCERAEAVLEERGGKLWGWVQGMGVRFSCSNFGAPCRIAGDAAVDHVRSRS